LNARYETAGGRIPADHRLLDNEGGTAGEARAPALEKLRELLANIRTNRSRTDGCGHDAGGLGRLTHAHPTLNQHLLDLLAEVTQPLRKSGSSAAWIGSTILRSFHRGRLSSRREIDGN